jgi:hypothetical protein
MAHATHHAKSSAKKFGGVWEDYIEIHDWFDASKGIIADCRHRALRHHAEGIKLCAQVFGPVLVRQSDNKEVPTTWIAEQHVLEDFGFIPTAVKWLELLPKEPWMMRGARRLSEEVKDD